MQNNDQKSKIFGQRLSQIEGAPRFSVLICSLYDTTTDEFHSARLFELTNSEMLVDNWPSGMPWIVRLCLIQSKLDVEGRGRQRIRLCDEIVIEPNSAAGARRFSEVWESHALRGKHVASSLDEITSPPYGDHSAIRHAYSENESTITPECLPAGCCLEGAAITAHMASDHAGKVIGNARTIRSGRVS